MNGHNAAVSVLDDEERRRKFISIIFQEGPIPEVGVNGCFIEDVLQLLVDRVQGFQFNPDGSRGPLACRENALAITAMEEAMNWFMRRRINRTRQGVQGSYQPHQ